MLSFPKFKSEELPDGRVIVRDVPVFAECEKDGMHFDAAWIDDAVKYQQALETRSATPVHIGHHGEAEPVKPAGAWFNTRAVPMLTKFGKKVRGAIADLLFTSKDAADRARRGELLWRSCEIPRNAALRVVSPRFRSLALLDKHAPHVDDLPALAFANTSPGTRWSALDVPGAVLAFNTSEDAVCVLMEPDAMPETAEKPRYRRMADGSIVRIENGVEAPIVFMDDEKPADEEAAEAPADDKEPAAEAEAETSKVEALVEKIKKFKGNMDEIGMLRSALESLVSDAGGEGSNEPAVMEDGPGDPITEMANDDQIVSLRAEVEALKKRETAREAQILLDRAVDEQHERCKDRGVTRDELLNFAQAAKDPVKGAKVYADMILARVPVRGASFEDHIGMSAEANTTPDELVKFQAKGPEVYARAIKDHKSWSAAKGAGRTRLSFDDWHAAGSMPGFVSDVAQN